MAPTSGVHYHRIMLPISGLALENSLVTNSLEEIRNRIQAGQCDILIYNRYLPGMDVAELVALRDQYKFKIVVDNDDYWELDPHHILHYHYTRGITKQITDNLKIADLVTVTHFRLAKKARQYNEKVFVIPNALPFDQYQFTPERAENKTGRVRIGWAGGVTHEKDLEILRGPIKRLHSIKNLSDQVEMRIFGYNEATPETKEIWGRMTSAFTNGGKMQYLAFPPLDVNSYMATYEEMDLALVPLLDTSFNGYKSNLKILEAGAKRLPVICSQVLPYYEGHNIPGVSWVSSQRDWVYHISKYVQDPHARERDGMALGAWVRQNFNLAKWSTVRGKLFKTILNQ